MYKTIEECKEDLQRFSMEIDIHYAGVYSLFSTIKKFVNIFSAPFLYGLIALDASYYFKYYIINKRLLIIINIIAMTFLLCKYILEKSLEENITKDHVQTKLNVCMKCFENYEQYEELADSERVEIFEKQLCSCIGLIKAK